MIQKVGEQAEHFSVEEHSNRGIES
jgi:hypothetical protein